MDVFRAKTAILAGSGGVGPWGAEGSAEIVDEKGGGGGKGYRLRRRLKCVRCAETAPPRRVFSGASIVQPRSSSKPRVINA